LEELGIIDARLRFILRPSDDYDHAMLFHLIEMTTLQLAVILARPEHATRAS
jgi:hypothetical protein